MKKLLLKLKGLLATQSVSDFHTVLGQFLNYHIALSENEPERILYLAVPLDTYETFFQTRLAKIAVQRYQVKLIVYDPIMEVIAQWQI